ncbi:MAG: hypothetical protein LBH37_04315 [Oscillospiraceae bacterium]|nr:hypothetical protein [Oscillospiraceae bacterium]
MRDGKREVTVQRLGQKEESTGEPSGQPSGQPLEKSSGTTNRLVSQTVVYDVKLEAKYADSD